MYYRNRKSGRIANLRWSEKNNAYICGAKLLTMEQFEKNWEVVDDAEDNVIEKPHAKEKVKTVRDGNVRSSDWLRSVRLLPCANCGSQSGSQAAHSNQMMWGKGKSLKAHDCCVFPLCATCHAKHDQGGLVEKGLWQSQENVWIIKTMIDLWIKGAM
jgi:membrane-bound inhibitor of C-type lysozyme